MIHITNNTDCCGCAACEQICPKNCITMTQDSEGFLYPTVDENACVNCGRCDSVCPIHNKREAHSLLKAFAFNLKDKEASLLQLQLMLSNLGVSLLVSLLIQRCKR